VGVTRAFRLLSLATVAAIFGLITLGGVVRVTDSGLGCPDWPLCHGRAVPPLEKEALIEYSHRLTASLVGLLAAAVTVLAWRFHLRRPWLVIPATLGLALVVVQALVGALAVETELSSTVVLVHLALAQALLATFLLVAFVAHRSEPRGLLAGEGWRGRGRLPALALGTAAATYGLLLLGSYVTVSGASAACGGAWPLCSGKELVPLAQGPAVHMLHRAGSLLVGLLLLATVATALRRERHAGLAWAAAVAGGLFLIQMLVGAANVWLGFPLAAKLLHLILATAVWMALVTLALLALAPPKARPESGRKALPEGAGDA
jgi:heme A synthase